jgi:hypothetical protein
MQNKVAMPVCRHRWDVSTKRASWMAGKFPAPPAMPANTPMKLRASFSEVNYPKNEFNLAKLQSDGG